MQHQRRLPRLARAAAAILVAAVFVGIGVAFGRASVSSSTTAQPLGGGEHPAPLASPNPAPAPVAPANAGPTRVVHGVPVGFADTRHGALMAAVSFTRVVGGALLLHPDQYRAALQVMAVPAYADALRAKGESVLSTLETRGHLISNAASGLPVVIASYPMTASVTAYSETTADVSVFGAALVGDGVGPVSGGFGGGTYTLAWTLLGDGTSDWRIAATQTTSAWDSSYVTFPGAPQPRPAFIRDLEDLGDAPPSS